MKRWHQIFLVLIASFILYHAFSYVRFKRLVRQHQASYRATLAAYSSALKAGMTREQVEDYLRSQGTAYGRTCCEAGVFSDITRIGREESTFLCREWNIYIRFQFNGETASPEVAGPADTLRKIDLFQNGRCL